jgi:hypothetical protein
MRGFPDGNREEGRGIVSDGAGERESIFRATHEEVFVAGVAQASRLGAAGDREGHSRAEHKRVHRVARHFTVVATLRVTSTIREQRPTVVQKSKFWRHCDLSRDQKSTNAANARDNGFLSQSYQSALFVLKNVKNETWIEHVHLPREINCNVSHLKV